MANQITKRRIERWLVDHGFEEIPAGATGHRYFTNGAVKVTLSAHGRQEVSPKNVRGTVRVLERAGFDRAQVTAELRTGEWKQPQ